MIDAIEFSLLCTSDIERERIMLRLAAYRKPAGNRSRSFYYSYKDGSIFVHTSLPALIHGTNEKTFSYEELIVSLKKLEEILEVSLENTQLCGIEVAASFDVEQPPTAYMNLWGTLSRAQKDILNSGQTVQFWNKSWSFIGYDKVAELNDRYGIHLKGRRILRLEHRIKRGVSKLFGRRLSPWDLLDPAIYCRLIERWKRKYTQIPKNVLAPEFSLPSTPKAFVRRLASVGIRDIGAGHIEALINEAYKQGLIGATTASRIREVAGSLMTNAAAGDDSPLTEEINLKIDQLVEREQSLCRVGVERHE